MGDHPFWKALFALPEPQETPVGHLNHCDLCRAEVGPFEKRCPACGGVWRETGKNPHRLRNYLFGISSMAISTAFGTFCHSLFKDYFQRQSTVLDSSATINPEMWRFLDSYLWLIATVAMLFLSTFVFERLHVAPTGRWVQPERAVDRKSKGSP
jgi:hypothetical protein